MKGGNAQDTMRGGDGNDSMEGENGKDWMDGGDHNDWMDGGADNDTMYGGEQDDTMYGGDGRDKMYGEDGYDLMDGGAGYDTLSGGEGSDTLTGGEGNDRFEFDVTTVENHWVGKYQSWVDSKYQDSVDVVTDFHHGYYLEENDTLVFNVNSGKLDRMGPDVENVQANYNFFDHDIDTAQELDKYVTVREVGPGGTDVAIWFDSQGFDFGVEDQWGDSRTPNEDIIVLVGVGTGLGLINSLDDLVEANYNIEVVDHSWHGVFLLLMHQAI